MVANIDSNCLITSILLFFYKDSYGTYYKRCLLLKHRKLMLLAFICLTVMKKTVPICLSLSGRAAITAHPFLYSQGLCSSI